MEKILETVSVYRRVDDLEGVVVYTIETESKIAENLRYDEVIGLLAAMFLEDNMKIQIKLPCTAWLQNKL
jgi:hypothetical protein